MKAMSAYLHTYVLALLVTKAIIYPHNEKD